MLRFSPWYTVTPYTIIAENSAPSTPAAAPSTVLFGLTFGMSLCLPKAFPKNSAKPSLPMGSANMVHAIMRQYCESLSRIMPMAMMGSAG